MQAKILVIPLLALACPALAADRDPRVAPAIEAGAAYLEGRQAPDGSFQGTWHGKDYRTGETALALLALLKAGSAPDAPEIERGFRWLLAQPHKRVYCVSVAVLALEARYTPPPKASIKDDEPLRSQIRRRFQKRAPGRDLRWLTGAVEFLERSQHESGLWRYPSFGEPDLSNAQFAILALKAAARMGARIDKEVLLKSVEYLLNHQEQGGADVASFPVPAADRPIAGLLDRRERKKRERERRKKKGTRTRGDDTVEVTTTTARMKARGWGYGPGAAPRGSMTAAGLAVLVVCKSELEANKGYQRNLAGRVDQALRDGAAWMAHRFRADRNPGAENDWLFYYLYTLERAGTLLALNRFGPHDWYAAGAETILGSQQGDGRFHVGTGGEQDGDIVATCFGILFLERSTVPIIKRPMTGGGAHAAPGAAGSGPIISLQPDGSVQVTFTYQGSPGQQVSLAGSFNSWSKDATRMRDAGGGSYTVTVPLSKGRHTYKFVIDGSDWRADPKNPKGEPDGHGGQNSLLEL